MKFNSLGIVMLSLLIYLSGCTTMYSDDDKELDSLVMAFIKEHEKRLNERAKRHEKGIKILTVDEKSANQFTVTADLEKASISEVVRRIIDASDKFPQFDQVKTYGNITANFKNLPLLQAINLILESNMLVVEQQGNTIVITKNVEEDEAQLEITLENLNISTAMELLNSMYDSENFKQGIIPSSNTIYLKGTKNEISKASQFLLKVDREIPHVFIEVLIVELNTDELQKLGSKFEDLQGKYGSGINYGATENILTFSKQTTPEGGSVDLGYVVADAASILIKASVDILIATNKARLISRPYISTLSGQEAVINMTNERHVIIMQQFGSSTQPITAGVNLKITPVVLGNNKLKMTIDVEDSQFTNITLDQVSAEVKKNQAKTIMQVDDGQTIIIGGLVSNRRSWGNSGFPGLRHIPILNLFFANQTKEILEKEVMIYVTPRIWKPGMVSPLIYPDAFRR